MKKLSYILRTLIAFVIVTACNEKPTESPTSTSLASDTILSPSVTSAENPAKATDQDSESTIWVTGYIDVPPENRAAVSPYYGGFVQEIYVLPGQSVKQGEVLFTLQNPDYLQVQQDYLEAKEQLAFLKTDFERQKMLSEEKITSTKSFKKAESDYKVMLARYRSLREQIGLMGVSIPSLEAGQLSSSIAIKAPIMGYITSVHITKSVFADAQEVALELVNVGHIHLELDVFEQDALRVKEGQAITFTVPESGTQSYRGQVHLVVKSIAPQKRTVKVHGHIIQEDAADFIPGMFVEAKITL